MLKTDKHGLKSGAIIVMGAGLTLLLAPAAWAQDPAPKAPMREPRDRSVYVSNEQLKAIEDGVPANPATGKPGAFSKRVVYGTSFIRLSEPDVPHQHGSLSEIFVVREGAGILETGGTITGVTGHDSATHKSIFLDPQGPPRPAAPAARGNAADLAGTAIEGGVQQLVKAGDLVLIPAGVAHHWLRIDKPVVYFDTKFPKAD